MEDTDKLLEEYIRDMRYCYPNMEMELIRATCEQAIREGIRDVTIVWEWLQDEI